MKKRNLFTLLSLKLLLLIFLFSYTAQSQEPIFETKLNKNKSDDSLIEKNSFFINQVAYLKKLVEISSGSYDPDGVNQIQKIMSEDLKELGFKIEERLSPNPKMGKLIIATKKGTSNKYVTLLGHADTVFEKFSTFKTFEISKDNKIATGPGVIDNKGGLVVMLSGLSMYLKNNPNHTHSLRVIISPGEEVGTPEFFKLFKELSLETQLLLGFEPCLEDGSIIESRRGNRWYHIKVTGQEAHAGRAHKDGINACWEISKKLDSISNLTNYTKDITVSIGHIEGGKDKYNIVCGEASAKIDVRFSILKDRDETHAKIEKIIKKNLVTSFNSKKASTSSYEITDDTIPFSKNTESKKQIHQILQLIHKTENRFVTAKQSGGAADSNNFSRPGLAIIDGLGACGGKMHTPDEYIELSTLKTRSLVLKEFLETYDLPIH